MDTEKTLKPGEISQMLGVTGATTRNYVSKFAPYLSEGAKRKTQKRFTQDDLKVLKLAKSYLDQSYTYEQVNNLLESQNFDDILDQPLPQPEPEIDQTSALAIYRETIAAKDQYIDELKEDKDRLQRQLNYERLPFFRKWFSDPPE